MVRPTRTRELVEALLVQFRVNGYFGEDTAELIKKNAKTLGAALRRSGRDLTDKGELITLGPINLTTGGRPALEEEIAWIRHNAETRAR